MWRPSCNDRGSSTQVGRPAHQAARSTSLSSANVPAAADPAGAGTAPATAAANVAAPGSGDAAAQPAARPVETVAISALERTKYVAPRYPRAAQRRNASGYVDLAFTVTTAGTVADVQVTDSKPGTLFDNAAVEAVEQWEFQPAMENGQPIEKRVAVRMSFALQ